MTTTTADIDIEHARWLAQLSARGVHEHWQQRLSSPLPNAFAALRGLRQMLEAGQRNRRTAQRILIGAWALLAPRPTQEVPPDIWCGLLRIFGPSIDGDAWNRPESLVLLRGCVDEEAARSGMSWTIEPAVARCHAENLDHYGGKHYIRPRIFRTVAPREALLASITTNGESEVIVDPGKLGEITEVPMAVWFDQFPERIKVYLPDGMVTYVPDVEPWSSFRRAR
jgi:hypothetical protein